MASRFFLSAGMPETLRQSIYELLILRPTAEASDDIGALTYTVIFSLMERYAAFNPVTNAPTYY
jgi:hypothetical protein